MTPRRSRAAGRPRLPETHAVALVADAAARDRLAGLLGDRVVLVTPERAAIAIHDVAAADASAVLAEGFRLPTIVLLDEPHAELARAALTAGAAAVLSRHAAAGELLAALDAVAAGLLVVDPAARDAFARPLAHRALVEPLTPREREVLDMLAAGLSNRRIAERLAISENTAKAHVAAILAKLGAESRTEAVTAAIRLGLLYL
jgi:DNA-binding NarL/FixJ family response regulator